MLILATIKLEKEFGNKKRQEEKRKGKERRTKKEAEAEAKAKRKIRKLNDGGLNIQDSSKKIDKGRVSTVRPKSERYRPVSSTNKSETSPTNLIQKNLDDYLLSLTNFELKKKLESCPGNLGECPLLHEFREGLKKSISSHVSLTPKNDSRACKTSRIANTSRKDRSGNVDKDTVKMKPVENSEKKQSNKDVKMSSVSRGVIRSTRAQDLRSQSNRDLFKPKTTVEKTRTTSPYLTALPVKKKKCSGTGNTDSRTMTRSSPGNSAESKKVGAKVIAKNDKVPRLPYKEKLTKEKSSSAGDVIPLLRQRTQEIINPKIVKKTNSNQSTAETAAGDFTPPQLKKSQTFFICKGAKTGEGDDMPKEEIESNAFPAKNEPLSDGNDSEGEITSPKPKPLTHNDSFCLIVKSSQNWSQKNRSDDQKWLQYGLAYEVKKKKTNEKGILKNSNCDLKSVDSLEKIESEKIVRFSDELLRNKKALKKLVRRKKRIQNFLSPNWYQRNKLFQKYLQILKEKSVLLSDGHDTPDELKPFQVPIRVKEIYEAEMFGLHRKGKFVKNQTKVAYSC